METIATTERLVLRTWGPDDIDGFMPLATDPEVMRFITGGEPYPRETLEALVKAQGESQATRGWSRWALALREDPGAIVGFCGPGCMLGEVELGWWLRRDLWGRGLATEAATEALRVCFEVIGFPLVIAAIDPGNARSQAVAGRVGMRLTREFPYETEKRGTITLQRWELANPLPEDDRPKDARFARGCE